MVFSLAAWIVCVGACLPCPGAGLVSGLVVGGWRPSRASRRAFPLVALTYDRVPRCDGRRTIFRLSGKVAGRGGGLPALRYKSRQASTTARISNSAAEPNRLIGGARHPRLQRQTRWRSFAG